MGQDPEVEVIESIYDALEGDDPSKALALARGAIDSAEESDPVLHYLAGRALLQLDLAAAAAEELSRAAELDPDDPEFRVYWAWALFRACRFEEAGREIGRVNRAAEALGETHYVRALTLEREGRYAEAERSYERAAGIDDEVFPKPVRFDEEAFAASVEHARSGLPPEFGEHLSRVALIVEDLPSAELLGESEPSLDPEELLGLFCGPTLEEPSVFGPAGELPPRIYLFKRNLERWVRDEQALAEEIRVTLWHELGHYLGLDEAELEASGYE